jgi:hypothetical protein
MKAPLDHYTEDKVQGYDTWLSEEDRIKNEKWAKVCQKNLTKNDWTEWRNAILNQTHGKTDN